MISFSQINTALGHSSNATLSMSSLYNLSPEIPSSGLIEMSECSQLVNGISPVLNFDASSLGYIGNGKAIPTWSNTGTLGQNYNFTSVNSPIVGTSNGHYHITLNGSTQYMSINNSIPMTWFNNAGTYAGATLIYIVAFNDTSSPSPWVRLVDISNGNGIDQVGVFRNASANAISCYISNGNTTVLNNTASTYPANGNFNIFIINILNSASGSSYNVYVNSGTTISSTFTSPTSIQNRTTTQNFAGYIPGQGYYLSGSFRQISIYKCSMTPSQIANQYTTLKTNWNM